MPKAWSIIHLQRIFAVKTNMQHYFAATTVKLLQFGAVSLNLLSTCLNHWWNS